jgi:hypothetical protein
MQIYFNRNTVIKCEQYVFSKEKGTISKCVVFFQATCRCHRRFIRVPADYELCMFHLGQGTKQSDDKHLSMGSYIKAWVFFSFFFLLTMYLKIPPLRRQEA